MWITEENKKRRFKFIIFDPQPIGMNNSLSFNYGIDHLTIRKAIEMANGRRLGLFSKQAIEKIRASQQFVRDIVEKKTTVYGINTGFGILANTRISEEDTRTLQHKILQSHSVGVGNPVPEEIARLMMITKLHALAQGYSGIQIETLERIAWHL
jgi:histidine ammonia-lyase